MTKTEARNDKLRAAHDKLQDAVAEIVSGDDWKRMLKVASKFHRYSFNDHQVLTALDRSSCVGCDLVRRVGLRPMNQGD